MILLFLFPLVFFTGVSAVCPDKFLLFKRAPTAKNNFPKEYWIRPLLRNESSRRRSLRVSFHGIILGTS
ncbi:hypothetical protein L3Y34_017131 [Caenorhabditis briggsae]|uniref:Secreted protein n=1 Tax=Caenorhabditis briggsae TaxID=6238 RepID=A0AAE9DGM6_CAEBR|nr:hypothetical protein L3Y34_017131 [Caenorhabditis briggsae]